MIVPTANELRFGSVSFVIHRPGLLNQKEQNSLVLGPPTAQRTIPEDLGRWRTILRHVEGCLDPSSNKIQVSTSLGNELWSGVENALMLRSVYVQEEFQKIPKQEKNFP